MRVKPLLTALKHPLCGVHVLCAPQGTGKTVALARACAIAERRDVVTSSFHIYCNTVPGCIEFAKWCNQHWTSLHTNSVSDTLLSSERVALILHRFQHMKHHPKQVDFVVSLAEDSTQTKKFTVVVCTDDKTQAQQLLSTGSYKIRPVYY